MSKKRAALKSRAAKTSATAATRTVAVGTVAADREIAANVRASAKMFNQCLELARKVGLKVIEGLDTTTELDGIPIEAGEITIVDISRVY